MDGQRQRAGSSRGRRRKTTRSNDREARPEPVRIAARRPDSPLIVKAPPRTIAASAVPKTRRDNDSGPSADVTLQPKAAPEPRRIARIVQVNAQAGDDQEREREKLLARLMQSDGRGAITRAADEFLRRGFELPNEQGVHLQLLEHFDETRARESLHAMVRFLAKDPPVKKPVLDQRLRRLEEHADEADTRQLAADLRRTLRT
jgi:hypothetical protein